MDYGIQSYHESHFPVIIPNPVTLEPTETYSKEDMDYYVDMFKEIIHDAYADPSLIKNAPEFGETSQINEDYANDERTRAMTWRAYVKKTDPRYKNKQMPVVRESAVLQALYCIIGKRRAALQ